MVDKRPATGLLRRNVLFAACAGGIGLAGALLVPGRGPAAADAATDEAITQMRLLTGKQPIMSDRVRLTIPASFPTGYTVPLDLAVASAMTEADHVRSILVIAPRNPIAEVARFQFSPLSGEARVSTRIRLAQPQHVLAAAEMGDGTLLMASAWVAVATNGCT